MSLYGAVGVYYNGRDWQVSIATDSGERSTPLERFENDKYGQEELVNFIKHQSAGLGITNCKIVLVDTPSESDQLYPLLYKNFAYPRVIPIKRLALHSSRLNLYTDNLAQLAAEAAITGFHTDELLLETTNICTFNCLFCTQDHMTRKKQRMPLDTAIKIIDDYASNSIGAMGFHLMGEPSTNPDLPKIVSHAAELGIRNCLVTNASMLNRQTAEELFAHGLTHLTVSVQTFTREQYYAFKRPAPKFTYEKVMSNIKEIIIAKWAKSPLALIEIHIMDNSLNKPRGVKVINNDVEGQAALEFWVAFVREIATEYGDENILASIATQDTIKLAEANWPYGLVKIAPGIELTFKTAQNWINNFTRGDELIVRAKKGTCRMLKGHGMRQLALLSNGDAAMCCFDYDGKTKFANISKSSLPEIERKAQKIRNDFIEFEKINFSICNRCLGVRIKCFGDIVPREMKNDEIELNKIAIFGVGPEAIETMHLFQDIGIDVISFLEERYPSIPIKSIVGKQVSSFDLLPAEVEAIIFPPERTPTSDEIGDLLSCYNCMIIGQVDIVAINPTDRDRILPKTKYENLLKDKEKEKNELVDLCNMEKQDIYDELTETKDMLKTVYSSRQWQRVNALSSIINRLKLCFRL